MSDRARILAIDDDPIFVRSVQRILRVHDVTTVGRVSEAAEQLSQRQDFDLILCDLNLTDGSGPELLGRFPALSSKVVYVTGGATSDADQAFLDSPGVRWVKKPFTLAQLRDLAQRAAEGTDPTPPDQH